MGGCGCVGVCVCVCVCVFVCVCLCVCVCVVYGDGGSETGSDLYIPVKECVDCWTPIQCSCLYVTLLYKYKAQVLDELHFKI